MKPFCSLALLCGLALTIISGCKEQSKTVSTSSAATSPDSDSGTDSSEVTSKASKQSGPFLFREIASESGFSFLRNDDSHGQERLFEVNGGGAAVTDFDSDGWLDVFMTNGCPVPLALQSRETPGRLFRNKKTMTFAECSEVSGLTQYGYGTGCAAGDLNEDGFEDLYVGAFGPNQLWVNNGDGTFSENSGPHIPEVNEWSSSVAFADLNGDGNLDIYVANYVAESDTHPKLCPDSKPGVGATGCSPSFFDGLCDSLLLSDGSGGFSDASGEAGLLALPGKALGVAICDLGGDAAPEIYVANDGEPNFLFSIQREEVSNSEDEQESTPSATRSIKLHEQALFANVALNEQGFAQASMGVAAADLDRNGMVDIFLTHFFAETNTLYLNCSTTDGLMFQDTTRISSLGPPSLSKLAFGVVPIDVDNNGWKDLLVVNGHTNDRTWAKHSSEPYRMTPQLFQNQGEASFIDVSRTSGDYFYRELLGRGLAMGDLDRDGAIDAVVSHRLDPSVILRNESDIVGRSVILRLIGRRCSRTPFTAKALRLNTTPVACEHLVGGGSYQSANANEVHFGLGGEKRMDLEILWPDGEREEIFGLTPGYWTIRQGDKRSWTTDVR